jgi:hypothetical protein
MADSSMTASTALLALLKTFAKELSRAYRSYAVMLIL